MKFFRKIIKNTHFWPILIVLIFGLLAGRTLLSPGYFNMHDDLQMMRQLEMEKCFLDGQIPCRWIPDMGYGFGFPLFNFYPPLPYLIGQGIRLLSFSFVDTAKLTFLLSFLLSGVTMYFLAKEFFGKVGGVVSSIFYVWAPYHSVDIFVRGAMNEAWALAWFPLILWTAYRLINENKKITKWVVGLALAWLALLTSHNLMVLIFTPVFLLWCLIFLRQKKWNRLPHLAISGILAFGLAAFFTLPAFLEQKFVRVDTLVVGYYEYIAHFVSIGQLLISRFWGYGASVWGLADRMPFQIGHVHWVLSLVLIAGVLFRYVKTKKIDNPLIVTGFFLLIGWFALFMAHSRSTPIWQALPPLKFVQFPWRFLTLSTLAFSFSAGALVLFLKNKMLLFASGVLVVSLLILNWNYFRPEKIGPLTDAEKFSGAAWDLQRTAGIFDYLPVSARENPKGPQTALAEVMGGIGQIKNPKQGTNWASFNAKITSEKANTRIGIFYFPNWRVFVDGVEVGTFIPEEEKWGRMYIELPRGEHQVYLKLYNTPVRTASNIVSLSSWTLLLTFPFWRRKLPMLKSRHGGNFGAS